GGKTNHGQYTRQGHIIEKTSAENCGNELTQYALIARLFLMHCMDSICVSKVANSGEQACKNDHNECERANRILSWGIPEGVHCITHSFHSCHCRTATGKRT